MYSIVLVAAMTAAPEVPQFNGFFANLFHHKHHSSCYGCGGCYGGISYSSCYGCGGCRSYTYSTNCWGCSGCTGYACHGIPTASCYGCGGCLSFGGCISTYGPPGTSCYGQHFSPYSSCYGYGNYTTGSIPFYTVTTGYGPATEIVGTPVYAENLTTTQAQLQVSLPADAKLFVDGHLTSMTGAERSFNTPALTAGKDYQYTLKMEYVVEGATKTDSKQVIVRGGHRTNVTFGTAVDKSSSPVVVKLPEKAKLFVDGMATSATGGQHTFRTPELNKGQPYTYQFRAEIDRDGRTEVQTQKVVFRAGEAVNVDFTEMNAVRTAAK